MTVRIKYVDLVLPLSPMFIIYIANSLATYEHENAVTINFKKPSYSAVDSGYHRVEIRLENE